MGHAMMNALTVLLACLAAASAVPAHFPRGKTLIYKYQADVKAGIMEPAPFASQCGLEAVVKIQQDVSDPTLKNAYVVTLSDVKHALFNGEVAHYQYVNSMHPIVEDTKTIQEPFVIVYDESGKFQGVKFLDSDTDWSRNIKQAIASMLQLDLSKIHVQTPMQAHSFITHENTIHGTCQVSYNVHSKDQAHPENSNVFVVTKLHEPKNCSHFVQHVFDHVEADCCHVEPEDDMSTASRRVFEIENNGDEILIKKLIAHGVINYFPWLARSEAHYLLNNQTLVLDDVMPTTEQQVSTVSFQDVQLIRDVTFTKPKGNYALHASEDLTHGRRIVKLDVLIPKLKKMLGEAADYLEENHIDTKQPDWKHGQTINRLLHTMSYMDLGSLEQVYNVIQNAETPRDVAVKDIFLEMIPHVGTTACCLFTRNVIRKHKVSDVTAVLMLSKLPMHVKAPTERLLLDMEEMVKLGDSVSLEVKKASILCFATLVHNTFKHEHGEVVNPLLTRYLQRFLNHVKSEPTYYMRMVYMMAIKNVEVGNIHKLLEPIVRGELMISEKPHHIRVQAIWAIKKAILNDPVYAHNLLWPILSDTSLHLSIRIAAYDILIEQLPHMGRMMNLYWLMVYEKNEHLYNYHLTTIQGLANSVDPCQRPVREMARKILKFTRIRPVTGALSTKYHVDYVDPKYGHGEVMKAFTILDEVTGFPRIGSVEHFTHVARKPVSQFGIHWNIMGAEEGMDIVKTLLGTKTAETSQTITKDVVKNVLHRAAQDMPPKKEVHIDICVTMNGHVIMVQHYNKDTLQKLVDDLGKWTEYLSKINMQQIFYQNLYEMHVPTDMGLQAVLATRIPSVYSLKLNTIANTKGPITLKLKADARLWNHGEYMMSIYNPIGDVWHSIRRITSRDVALPLEMNLTYNQETQSLKITLPRLPVSKYSVAGISTFAKNYVTITEDETDLLKKSCDTCLHHTIVTRKTVQGEQFHSVSRVDSVDTGLHFYSAIYNCENDITPVVLTSELLRALSPEHKSTMNNMIVQCVMGVRQYMMNHVISPQVGNCGTLVKVEPSIIHPTSHVDISLRTNVEDLDHVHETMHVHSSKKINVRGIVDVKAASTNASVRSWDVNVNMDISQGHMTNIMKAQITRITPGQKNLKICVDTQKVYQVASTTETENVEEGTNMKVILAMGETDEDKCVRDDTVITLTTKGQILPETMRTVPLTTDTTCTATMGQEILLSYPRTMQQLNHAITTTTPRKYVMNVVYKKVPQTVLSKVVMMEDIIRSYLLPHVTYTDTYTESGNGKVIVKFPMDTHHADVSVVTPVRSYDLLDVPIGHPVWNLMMDNTRYSIETLYDHMMGDIRVCSICPQTLVTFDNGTFPLNVPQDEWLLVSGDYVHEHYAVFVKFIQGQQIAVKMYVGTHELHVIPDEVHPVVTLDGKVISHPEKGVMVPEDTENYAIRMTMDQHHFVMQSTHVPVTMYCTPTTLTVVMNTELQGHVTGVCGHMDGTHKQRIPHMYNVPEL